ncbi:MAG: hypothetical protein MJ252_03815 [archaeon]|nr:hypothetical protein [archaeon]
MKKIILSIFLLISVFYFIKSAEFTEEECKKKPAFNSASCEMNEYTGSDGKRCCYVKWKAQGRTYELCKAIEYKSGPIGDVRDDLKRLYSDVKIDCKGRFIEVGSIFILGLIAIIL